MSGLWKQYGWLGSVFFTLALSFFSAKIVGVYLASLLEVPRSIALVADEGGPVESPVVEDLGAYAVITERNVFDSSDEPTPEPCAEGDERPECQQQAVNQTPTGEAVKTSLPIKVLSTVVVGAGKDERSTAVVDAGGSKGIDVYAVRDPDKSFGPGIVLIQVKPRRIEFLNNNRLEFAEIEDDSVLASIFVAPEELKDVATAKKAPTAADAVPTGDKVAQVSDGKYVIDQGEIDAALSSLDQLYTQIRAVPNFEAGKVQGMKILSIKPGSIFAKLGLQRGDVLDRINGQQLDIKNGFQLFNQLKEQKQFSLDLKRGGKTESFEYEIR